MGHIVVTEFITLDGVIEDPGGGEKSFEHSGWEFQFNRGEQGDAFKTEELMVADAQLLGRVTYQGFAKVWPAMREETGEYGEKINSMPKHVVSTTLSDEDASWENSTVIRDDIPGAVRALKQDVPGDILVQGSATLAQTLAENDLVDRYRLMLFPIVLGTGKRLFPQGAPWARFELAQCEQVGSDGVLTLIYQAKR
jgi:dihydrofolate reductase